MPKKSRRKVIECSDDDLEIADPYSQRHAQQPSVTSAAPTISWRDQMKADREKWNRLEVAASAPDAVNCDTVPDSQNSNHESIPSKPKSIPVTASTAIDGLDLEDIDDFFDDEHFVPVTYPLKVQLALNAVRSEASTASTSKVVGRSSSSQISVSKDDVLSTSSNLWSEIFTPCHESELCLHAKKIEEVHNWLQHNIHALTVNQKAKQTVLPAKKLLILTGPAGCGKTSLLKAVCTKLDRDSTEGMRLISWTDLPSCDFQARNLTNSDENVMYESKLKQLRGFLLRSQRYQALTFNASSSASAESSNACQQVIVLDDLPFLGRPELQAEFNDILFHALPVSSCVMVLLLTEEHESGGHIWRLLDNRIQNSPFVDHIRCNPASNTVVRAALRRILQLTQFSIADQKLNEIIDSSRGDLRAAINAMQFQLTSKSHSKSAKSLQSDPIVIDDDDNEQVRSSKRARGKLATSKPTRIVDLNAEFLRDDAHDARTLVSGLSVGRDEQFSLFHCVGKILHAKGDYTPEYIVDRCEGTPGALFDFLFENYVDFSLDSDTAVSDAASSVSTECNMDISNDMSLADIMRGASRTEFTNPHRLSDEASCLYACHAYLSHHHQSLVKVRSCDPSFTQSRSRFAAFFKPRAFDARRHRSQLHERMMSSFVDAPIPMFAQTKAPTSMIDYVPTMVKLMRAVKHTPALQQQLSPAQRRLLSELPRYRSSASNPTFTPTRLARSQAAVLNEHRGLDSAIDEPEQTSHTVQSVSNQQVNARPETKRAQVEDIESV